MSKKKKDKNPFIEAFKKLPKDHTPQQVEQVIKEILRANGLNVENVSITTSGSNPKVIVGTHTRYPKRTEEPKQKELEKNKEADYQKKSDK